MVSSFLPSFLPSFLLVPRSVAINELTACCTRSRAPRTTNRRRHSDYVTMYQCNGTTCFLCAYVSPRVRNHKSVALGKEKGRVGNKGTFS